MSHTTAHQPAQARQRNRRAAAAATAAIANGIAWTVGHDCTRQLRPRHTAGDRQIALSATVAATTAAGMAGWGLPRNIRAAAPAVPGRRWTAVGSRRAGVVHRWSPSHRLWRCGTSGSTR